ncbi:uncharacterized protein DSM5745_02440 [Aspergillus mulundensis]|uniref:Uncharacterized protein n=1 Tax=Aspergillus mulundensis TaxID=1810919 RepID=A0A3D8SWI5_9EURO|nr:Uncharacterized protein DSM5745_02440 [Aspergillus mulundensis]RDW90665.1 Uncharacterized protein DSM5745_02440 [Aspergillus mulundensis]
MSLWKLPPASALTKTDTNTDYEYSSYKALSPKTRAVFGLGVIAWASVGLWTSSEVEQAMGMVPTEQEKAELDRKLAIRVSRVERD